MAERKKPKGTILIQWCRVWDEADHSGKVALCERFGITYESGRHWRSDSGVPTLERPASSAPAPMPVDSTETIEIDTGTGFSTWAVINDTHIPFEDKAAVSAMLSLLDMEKPDGVLIAGDVDDWYQLSSFDKDPARIHTLQNDLDQTQRFLGRVREATPDAQIILLDGNHEDRIRRHLWRKDPQLASLRCLELPKLYGLDKLEIESVAYEQGVKINDVFLVIHGSIISTHSAYTARRMYDKHGGSGMHGHTHRGGSYLKRNRSGIFGWWENYCLCTLNPDWIKHPDWQQGFSLVHFKGERFWVEQMQIIDGKFMFGGRLYG